MARFVRLRIKLIDEVGAFDEARPRKIMYGLNHAKHKLIRDMRLDLAAKVGIDSASYDLEVWVGDYIVPGYTSSSLLKEDEEVLVKIVPKGKNDETEHRESFAAAEAEMAAFDDPPEDCATVSCSTVEQKSCGSSGLPSPQVMVRQPFAGLRAVTPGSAGSFLKPAMQCFHWDSPMHVKSSCRFWHPRELCKNFPLCTHGANGCGFAHPFCGEICDCHPHARDPQKNHRKRMPSVGGAAGAVDGVQFVGEDSFA